ncbi:MerR family DNA-binding transcriptional regulator [Streptomyces capparidis]
MRIGELSARTGVSERSLRYYEEQGLLASDRTPGGHRQYPAEAVDRVICIQELFAAGLCSSKIAELLPCLRTQGGRSTASPDLVRNLEVERARIDRTISDLVRSREVLDEVIEEAHSLVRMAREQRREEREAAVGDGGAGSGGP